MVLKTRQALKLKSTEDQTEITRLRRKVSDSVRSGQNLADLFWDHQLRYSVLTSVIPELIHRLLVRDLAYSFLSGNLSTDRDYMSSLPVAFFQPKLFDTVLAIYQTGDEIVLVNPSDQKQWGWIVNDQINNLIVVYGKGRGSMKRSEGTTTDFLADIIRAFCETPRQPVQPRAQADLSDGASKYQVTPRYSIRVTNDHFHHGNAEAWRNIIQSYENKYPDHKIQIFFRDKPVYQFKKLFTWGAVSSGDVIQFTVAGKEIGDITKLKTYLTRASSPGFKLFIRKTINSELCLF